jgi:hypothetical protein
MDIGTATDFIKDLQEENARLHQAIANLCNEMVVLESERDELERRIVFYKWSIGVLAKKHD